MTEEHKRKIFKGRVEAKVLNLGGTSRAVSRDKIDQLTTDEMESLAIEIDSAKTAFEDVLTIGEASIKSIQAERTHFNADNPAATVSKDLN